MGRKGDGEKGRWGEREIGRKGDREKGDTGMVRWGDGEECLLSFRRVSPSPSRPVAASPRPASQEVIE